MAIPRRRRRRSQAMSRPRREQRRCPLRLPTNRRYALREGPAPSAHRLAARPKGLDREPGPSLRASLPRREPPPSLRSGDYSRRELLGDGGPTSPVSAFDSGHRESSETLGITLAARVVSRSNRGRRRAPRERSDCAEIRRAVEGRIRPSRSPVRRRRRSHAIAKRRFRLSVRSGHQEFSEASGLKIAAREVS